jgi:hypothetical protein
MSESVYYADSAQNPARTPQHPYTRSRGEGGGRRGAGEDDAADVRTASLGPEDGDDGVGDARPLEPRGGGELLHRGHVHLSVRAHHLCRARGTRRRLRRPRRVHGCPIAGEPKQPTSGIRSEATRWRVSKAAREMGYCQ